MILLLLPGHILLLCIWILITGDLPRIGSSSYGVVYKYVFLYHVIGFDITVALPCYIKLYVNMQLMYFPVPCKMVCLE